MHSSSETIGAIAGGARQGADRARQSGKDPDRDHPVAVPAGGEPNLSLRLAVQRARYRPQEPRPARDRDGADHRHRRGGRTIRLTTVLAHSSGEWISSDWPVCPVSETAAPQRMGAALTYARRYALFTLVGIAGEDDLDAPDLGGPEGPQPDKADPRKAGGESPTGTRHSPLNGHLPLDRTRSTKRRRVTTPTNATPVLAADNSAKLRDRLLPELAEVLSNDLLAGWAHRTLPAKNMLAVPDALQIETAFQERLAASTMRIGDIDRKRRDRKSNWVERGDADRYRRSKICGGSPDARQGPQPGGDSGCNGTAPRRSNRCEDRSLARQGPPQICRRRNRAWFAGAHRWTRIICASHSRER